MAKYKKQPNPEVVVSSNSPSLSEKIRGHKKLVIIIVSAIVVAIGLSAGWQLLRKSNQSSTPSCPQDILSDAVPILSNRTSDLTTRSVLVDKILTTNNYNSEPNCLAILTAYYIDTSDIDQAKSYYASLKQNYNESTGYDSSIGGYLLAPEAFDEQIKFLEQQSQAVLNKGGQYGGVFGDKSE